MSSNQEASKTAAQEKIYEIPVVHDRRRFTPEGEPVAPIEEGSTQPTLENASTPLSGDPPHELEQLQAQLRESEEKRAEAERKAIELAERFRRAQEQMQAEASEQRARMQRNFDQKLNAARGEVVASLLDSLDNLKRAVAAAEQGEKRPLDFDALLEGVRATAGLFDTKMQALGLQPVPSVGEDFNPELHEAVEMVAVPPEQDHKVIAEFQTGYKFGDQLLRPARVRVGRAG
jgi:molecular chaperone GrpE